MKRIKWVKVLCLLFVCFILTGCGSLDSSLTINKDKSMNIEIKGVLSEEYLNNSEYSFSNKEIKKLESNGYTVKSINGNSGYLISKKIPNIDQVSNKGLIVTDLNLTNLQDNVIFFEVEKGLFRNTYKAKYTFSELGKMIKDINDSIENYEIKNDTNNRVNIYLFESENCTACEDAKKWFDSLEEKYHDMFNLNIYDTWNNPSNEKEMKNISIELSDEKEGIPYIIIGNKTWHNFDRNDIANEILAKIEEEYNSTNRYEKVNDIVKNSKLKTEDNKIDIYLFKTENSKNGNSFIEFINTMSNKYQSKINLKVLNLDKDINKIRKEAISKYFDDGSVEDFYLIIGKDRYKDYTKFDSAAIIRSIEQEYSNDNRKGYVGELIEKTGNYDIKFIVNLPYKAIYNNATSVNDNQLIWNIEKEDNVVEFSFKLYNYINIVAVIVFLIVFAIFIKIFFGKGEKKEKETEIDKEVITDNEEEVVLEEPNTKEEIVEEKESTNNNEFNNYIDTSGMSDQVIDENTIKNVKLEENVIEEIEPSEKIVDIYDSELDLNKDGKVTEEELNKAFDDAGEDLPTYHVGLDKTEIEEKINGDQNSKDINEQFDEASDELPTYHSGLDKIELEETNNEMIKEDNKTASIDEDLTPKSIEKVEIEGINELED